MDDVTSREAHNLGATPPREDERHDYGSVAKTRTGVPGIDCQEGA